MTQLRSNCALYTIIHDVLRIRNNWMCTSYGLHLYTYLWTATVDANAYISPQPYRTMQNQDQERRRTLTVSVERPHKSQWYIMHRIFVSSFSPDKHTATTKMCNEWLELWRSSSKERHYGGLAVARERLCNEAPPLEFTMETLQLYTYKRALINWQRARCKT